MKLHSKSEWLELESPLAEPNVKWDVERWNTKYTEKEPNTYLTERTVESDGKIVWFGIGINWKKEPNEGWTVLSTDESIKPLEEGGCVYPKGRICWKPCETPIYEKLYQQLNA